MVRETVPERVRSQWCQADENVCTYKEMASFTCSCPDAMMACDTGHDSGMYAALAFMLLAIAVWSQCACDWGSDECSSDDEVPEGMFT